MASPRHPKMKWDQEQEPTEQEPAPLRHPAQAALPVFPVPHPTSEQIQIARPWEPVPLASLSKVFEKPPPPAASEPRSKP